MKLTKKTASLLLETIGETLVKIGSESFNDKELDNILLVLLNFLSDMKGLKIEVIKDIDEKSKYLEDKKMNEKLLKMKNAVSEKIEYSEEVKERLYKFFDDDINEGIKKSVASVSVNEGLEVLTKNKGRGTKIYFEMNKVLLTMLTSDVASREEVDDIKERIEKGYGFGASIEKIIKSKIRLGRISELVKLQNLRFEDEEARSKSLY